MDSVTQCLSNVKGLNNSKPQTVNHTIFIVVLKALNDCSVNFYCFNSLIYLRKACIKLKIMSNPKKCQLKTLYESVIK